MRKSGTIVGGILAAGVALSLLAGCSTTGNLGGGSTGGDDGVFTIATVSKVEGVSWFQRMAEGVKQFGEDNSDVVEAYQTGPDTGDPAKQVQIVQDLIAQGVDAIVVIPNDPQSIAPVLKQARDAGIVVITHEAPALVGTDSIDFDLEAFDNKAFGEHFGEELATAMGGSGDIVGMVGSLTSETHMAWYNAALDYLAANYPDIKPVAAQPYEDDNDDAKARANALEILKAYPNLKGYIGTSVSAGSSFAAVLKEKNITSVSEVALSLPSIAGPYLEEGWMKYAQAWDPAGAGYAANSLALAVLQDRALKSGDDLGYEGYKSVVVDGTLVLGEATLPMRKGDYADAKYPF